MTRRVVVLRPEPGNAATMARLAAAGLHGIALPLFDVRPLGWEAPDPAQFDALLLTSANAVRHAGGGLAAFRDLPVIAVGAVTAQAARAAGLDVVLVGDGGVAAILAAAAGRFARLLHLGGRDRYDPGDARIARTIAVYASEARRVPDADARQLAGSTAMIHSARAGAALAALVDRIAIPRASVRIAAISSATAMATGDGWGGIATATRPGDDALIDAVSALRD